MRVACDCADQPGACGAVEPPASVEQLWLDGELFRERYWQHDPSGSFNTFRRRAFLAARLLPILPGRQVLELGAGSGVWTAHLAAVLAGRNPIAGATFSAALAAAAQSRKLPGARFIHVTDFQQAFPRESFDYIVGTDVPAQCLGPVMLGMAYQWLKPGGRFLFFTQNASNPFTFLKKVVGQVFGQNRGLGVEDSFNLKKWTHFAAREGFEGIEVAHFEVIRPRARPVWQTVGLILERAPLARRFSRIVSVRALKPALAGKGNMEKISLARHPQLSGTISVVVPCHNEEANIALLVGMMLGTYGSYIHEIVIVDDNSTDGTARVAETIARTEPRVKLVKRNPPGGVGRALREGYATASGKYILSIDCDFVAISSEFEGLFDAVAEGYDGAIGSRFSSESALVHYPFFKILCNRGYHWMLNLLLGKQVRDISNNLKLYRAEILNNLDIEANGFAANAETGLKPVLLNYRIREVPVSWIDRTPDMGRSSFNLLKVGPEYLGVLLRTTWRYWRGQYRISS